MPFGLRLRLRVWGPSSSDGRDCGVIGACARGLPVASSLSHPPANNHKKSLMYGVIIIVLSLWLTNRFFGQSTLQRSSSAGIAEGSSIPSPHWTIDKCTDI